MSQAAPRSIAVFGTGPALGRAVAHRWARDGYAVVVVARRRAPLEQAAAELASMGRRSTPSPPTCPTSTPSLRWSSGFAASSVISTCSTTAPRPTDSSRRSS
jgi:NAD(P)-dependent dehydrogenase (short-subunit alcohol dehydrogenase family)